MIEGEQPTRAGETSRTTQLMSVSLVSCSRPLPTLEPVYQYDLVNAPGKCIVGMHVKFPPNGSTPPHRHGTCSLIGYVVEGTTYNKMNDQPTKTFTKGDTWYEAPGCHHKQSDNASDTEPLTLLATFILDKKVLEEQGQAALLIPDPEYKDIKFPQPS